ncbi:MAG: hypothetical protein IT212_07795 [Bacteroidia bacterium]|nr:hypothetical protein [Bacteroidia bacterium]
MKKYIPTLLAVVAMTTMAFVASSSMDKKDHLIKWMEINKDCLHAKRGDTLGILLTDSSLIISRYSGRGKYLVVYH